MVNPYKCRIVAEREGSILAIYVRKLSLRTYVYVCVRTSRFRNVLGGLRQTILLCTSSARRLRVNNSIRRAMVGLRRWA